MAAPRCAKEVFEMHYPKTAIPLSMAVEELSLKPEMSLQEVEKLKRKHSQKLGLAQIISNSQLIAELKKRGADGDAELIHKLRKSAVRSMSGVNVVAIMLPPVSCPYKCAYCPTSTIAAKSYTGHEPAALRARQNDFDSYRQVESRLAQFELNGHLTEKCELIVMGGTFNTLAKSFQEEFVKRAYDAFNQKESASLDQAIILNESARHRVVALTFETRPDWAGKQHVQDFLRFGATRIELGVQSLDDEVLAKVKRGHGVAETIDATRNCKDAFLKVGYHIMPGLYSTPDKDEQAMKTVFEDQRFRPDMLKIYPTLVIPGTELYELWKKGEFEPYDEEKAAEAIARMKKHVPEYCRIMRVDRDIPTHQIAAGVKKTNLRELVEKKCVELGIKCRCIRCREAGLRQHKRAQTIDFQNAHLKVDKYYASEGKEFFLHFEDASNDALIGFLRLRKPSEFGTEGNLSMGVRELRVYGEQLPIGDHSQTSSPQHKSFGKKLMQAAEEIAAQEGGQELLVTSGVGVREYYGKLGYCKSGTYMSKKLR